MKTLEKLLEDLDKQITHAVAGRETNDSLEELFDHGQKADKLPMEFQDLKLRQAKLEETLAQLKRMKSNGVRMESTPRKTQHSFR